MRKKRYFVIPLIELIVFILIMGVYVLAASPLLPQYLSAKDGLEKLERPDFYAVSNDAFPDTMMQKYEPEKADSFYRDYIKTGEKQYTMYGYMPSVNESGIKVQRRLANKDFFDLYAFKVQEGRMFNEADFEYRLGEEIPILVGARLQAVYELGQLYPFTSGDDGRTFNARVVGVLEPGSGYAGLQNLRESLDNSYIIPLNDTFQEQYFGLSDYDMTISSTIIKTDDKDELDRAVDKINEAGIWSLKAVPVSEALESYERETIQPQRNRLIAGLVVFGVLLVGIVIQTGYFYKRHK